MKKRFSILIILLSLYSATSFALLNPDPNKLILDITKINYIDIIKTFRPPDTTICVWKRLNKEDMKVFISKWNSSKSAQNTNYKTNYKLAIYFNDKTIKEFRANGRFINENNKKSVDINDDNYFEKLYLEAKAK